MIQNPVLGIPEPEFRASWIAVLRIAMAKTGKGYKRQSLRHTGKDDDRRADKLAAGGRSKLERRLQTKAIAHHA
jgi:hypothetical protein